MHYEYCNVFFYDSNNGYWNEKIKPSEGYNVKNVTCIYLELDKIDVWTKSNWNQWSAEKFKI